MTYEKAIDYVFGGAILRNPSKDRELRTMIIEALEKQVPKKPIVFISDRYDYPEEAYRCSICDSDNGEYLYKGQRYCDECGNAVDWSDVK